MLNYKIICNGINIIYNINISLTAFIIYECNIYTSSYTVNVMYLYKKNI